MSCGVNLIKFAANNKGSYCLSDEKLLVRMIKNGTVLDHLESGTSFLVLDALNISGAYSDTVMVAMNVPSDKMDKKDIVKISSKFLSKDETNRIALIAPSASVNLINDFKVTEKRSVELPEMFVGIFNCPNPTCVSNSNEPIESSLKVAKKKPVLLRCKYCSRVFGPEDLIR